MATAPGVVQNLNMASDLYGDRSNIRFPFDTGVQVYSCTGAGGTLTPLRTLNTHLLAGESEPRADVGCDYTATFADSSFLPKGFASDQFYFAVTSIGISFVEFGISSSVSGGVTSAAAITSDVITQDLLSLGASKGETNITGSGIIGAAFMRAFLAGIWIEYLQDGRKCSFVFDSALAIPSGVGLNDQASIGLSMPNNRLQLPVPFLLSPRNTNQSQEIVKVHAAALNPVLDPTSQAQTATGSAGNGKLYALKYKLDFAGYFSDEKGNPANQNWSLATAAAAAEYRPVG